MKKTGCKVWVFILKKVSDIEGEIDLWSREINKYFKVLRVQSYDEAINLIKQINE